MMAVPSRNSSINATHICSLPLHANPGRLDPCVGRHWIALPMTKTIIGLWKISQTAKEFRYLELIGHSKEISAISFSNDRIKYLLSACREKILLWDLLSEMDGQIPCKRFCSMSGEATALCINNNNDLIAAGVDFKIHLLKEGNKCPLTFMEAHRGMVTGLQFCPHYSATLVSVSDDRSFCVWDVQDSLLLHSSKIISSSPLISLCMNWMSPQFAVGTADGCLKVFDLTDGNNFRQLSSLNISLNLQKHFEKESLGTKPLLAIPTDVIKYGKQQNMDFSNVENPTIVQVSESVLSIEYVYFAQAFSDSDTFINTNSGIGSILTEKPPLICVITSNAILQINSRTLEILSVLNMQNPMLSQSFCSHKNVGLLSYAASCQTGPSQVFAVVGTVFQRNIEVIQWELVERQSQVSSDKSENSSACLDVEDIALSIIPVSTVLSSSPLKSEMLPPVTSDHITKGDVATGKKKSLGIMNQPLTFKSKIKSSGYSQAPRTTLFIPETTRNKVLKMGDETKSKQNEKRKTTLGKMLKSEYDASKGPPSENCDTFQVDHQGSAVFTLRFSDDGNALGCALSNGCALTLKSPYRKHISTYLVGHKNAVNSLYWSNSAAHLVTSSNDKTVFLWEKTGGDPVLSLTHHGGSVRDIHPNKINFSVKPNVTSSSSYRNLQSVDSNSSRVPSLSSTENKPFNKDISHAQFFYVDKFILLSHGAELLLYKYNITPDRDEIKRYQSRNRYKLVASWQTSSSLFTATAAVNAFFSHLVICTTSGRNMEVYDLNKSILAHVFTECHSRPAHSVTINEGSCFASQSSEAYNVIASASPTDPIKLWDLRTKTNVQALQGHVNNAYACQIAFSPCGNYLASGSENYNVYIFDLRKGTYIDCLRGHNEVVTSVAFHPAYPLLASGSLNGKIIFFKSK